MEVETATDIKRNDAENEAPILSHSITLTNLDNLSRNSHSSIETVSSAEPVEGYEGHEGFDDVLSLQENIGEVAVGDCDSDLYDDAVLGMWKSEENSISESSIDQGNLAPNLKDNSLMEQLEETVLCVKRVKRIAEAYTQDLVEQGANNRGDYHSFRDRDIFKGQGRKNGVYVGNLTWWTKHEDIEAAFGLIGISDVIDVKIYECRLNGQSKGFCFVTFTSESSISLAFDKLKEIEINGRVPIIKPDSKASLLAFESQSKTRPPTNSAMMQSDAGLINGSGLQMPRMHTMYPSYSSSHGMPQRPPVGYGMRQPFPRYGSRFGTGGLPYNPGSLRTSDGIHHGPNNNGYPNPRMPNTLTMPPRGPPPPINGSFPNCEDWTRPYSGGNRANAHVNPAFISTRFNYPVPEYGEGPPIEGPIPFFQPAETLIAPGTMSPSRMPMSPANSARMPMSPRVPPNAETNNQSSTMSSINNYNSQNRNDSFSDLNNKAVVDELLSRNNSISSLAIRRAVTDAASGEYASAIETLVTAISLIKSSKVARDRRCQVLISSLQDALEGIEHRSYGRGSDRRSSDQPDRVRIEKPYYYSSRGSNSISSSSRCRSRSRERQDYSSYKTYKDDRNDERSRNSNKRNWDERDRRSDRSSPVPRDIKPKMPRGDDLLNFYRKSPRTSL